MGKMLFRNCPEFSAFHDPGNDNQIIINLLKNMSPQTTTDTAVILTSGFKLTSDH